MNGASERDHVEGHGRVETKVMTPLGTEVGTTFEVTHGAGQFQQENHYSNLKGF